MRAIDRSRRAMLGGIAGLALTARAAASEDAAMLRETQHMHPGPFYPDEIPLDHDNDLLRYAGGKAEARGTPLDLTGTVVDARGRPLRDVRVEIWQCDATGRYHHVGGDDTRGDAAFQGFGTCDTDARGAWRFRTIRPVAYSGRTPHIHFKVRGGDVGELVTQMFVRDDPGNAGDWIYNRLSREAREQLSVAMLPQADGSVRGEFRLVMAGEQPT